MVVPIVMAFGLNRGAEPSAQMSPESGSSTAVAASA
jgi:hypothetical protein